MAKLSRIFQVTFYERKQGPVCFEIPLINWIHYLPAQLLSLDLVWYWCSYRDAILVNDAESAVPVAEESPVQDLPEIRSWTLLEHGNEGDLIDDFHEWTVDGNRRSIFLLGFEPGFAPSSMSEEALDQAGNLFLEGHGPLEVVIFNENDSYAQFVFVWQEDRRTKNTNRLLDAWHLDTLPPTNVRGYGRLGVVMIENLFPLSRLP
jgi:hypothetical protein